MVGNYKNYLLTFFILTSWATVSYGQKLTTKLADSRFNEFAYVEAIQLYKYAYQKDTSSVYLIKQLAEANHRIGNNQQTEYWLKKLIDLHQEKPEDIYNYFQALKCNGKYESAQYWLSKYDSLNVDKHSVGKASSFLGNIKHLKDDSLNYEIFNVSLNTEGSELGPAFYKDQVIFSSTSIQQEARIHYKWNELPYLHMYSAKPDSSTGDLFQPEAFAPKLRTAYHDGPACFDEKNNIIYFTRNNIVKGKTAKSKDGVVNLKIFWGKHVDGEWKPSGEFKYNSDEYSVGHPSVNEDGTILYFASDMPGGYGKSDIYYSVRSGGNWSKPVNLGPFINTSGNEFFPFISKEGILYFASDRTEGLGGMDIYYSLPQNGIFNKCHNMGYPVNSSSDDFGLTLDQSGMKGYFCSNRPGGKGNDDIYFLKMKSDSLIIKGIIKEKGSDQLIADAMVSLIDKDGLSIVKTVTDDKGEFTFQIRSKEQFFLKVKKEGYEESIIKPESISHALNKTKKQEIYLEKVIEHTIDLSSLPVTFEKEEGPVQIIEFKHINYDLDQSSIRLDAAAILDKLIVYLKENPNLLIKIESHTDSRSDDVYNMILSKRRAVAAFDYIVSKGVDADRISYFGYGETRLVNNCGNGVFCTEKQHEANRRSIVTVYRRAKI
ncbi:MAG: OmpA family protein [Candidatus Saccharibacteria bacterium]